ncbi:hypothetical protein A5692_00360 [Mycobacterium sp. E342]|nr:hypothetical protein A5692_00360 [Mycobacterium sp. E342]
MSFTGDAATLDPAGIVEGYEKLANVAVCTQTSTSPRNTKFLGLPDNLVALARDRIRYHRTDIEIDKLTDAIQISGGLSANRKLDSLHLYGVATTSAGFHLI